jgi:hypothetical protein
MSLAKTWNLGLVQFNRSASSTARCRALPEPAIMTATFSRLCLSLILALVVVGALGGAPRQRDAERIFYKQVRACFVLTWLCCGEYRPTTAICNPSGRNHTPQPLILCFRFTFHPKLTLCSLIILMVIQEPLEINFEIRVALIGLDGTGAHKFSLDTSKLNEMLRNHMSSYSYVYYTLVLA